MNVLYTCRLKRQKTCPNNGTRQTPCKECRQRPYRNAGKTSYKKIKIDILTLKIQGNKFVLCLWSLEEGKNGEINNDHDPGRAQTHKPWISRHTPYHLATPITFY